METEEPMCSSDSSHTCTSMKFLCVRKIKDIDFQSGYYNPNRWNQMLLAIRPFYHPKCKTLGIVPLSTRIVDTR